LEIVLRHGLLEFVNWVSREIMATVVHSPTTLPYIKCRLCPVFLPHVSMVAAIYSPTDQRYRRALTLKPGLVDCAAHISTREVDIAHRLKGLVA